MGAFEEALKKSAKKKFGNLGSLGNCIGELELAKYLEGSLPLGKRELVERHLADCAYCLDLLIVSRDILKEEAGTKASWFEAVKKQKWLILTIISFAFSFVVKKFFLQFLFLSLILGIKWALSSEGAKNLVMIFRSLSHREAENHEPEEKIFERK